MLESIGADDRNRTDDLRITNALLYQLSYIGVQEAAFYRSPQSRATGSPNGARLVILSMCVDAWRWIPRTLTIFSGR